MMCSLQRWPKALTGSIKLTGDFEEGVNNHALARPCWTAMQPFSPIWC